jgi:hypothetical protein
VGTRSWDGSRDERDQRSDRGRRSARQRWSASGESSIYDDYGRDEPTRGRRAERDGGRHHERDERAEPETGRWSSRRNRWVPQARSGDDTDTTADYTVRRFDDTGELPAQVEQPGRGRILDHDDWDDAPTNRPAWLTELVDDEPPYDPYWSKPRRAAEPPPDDPYWGRSSSSRPPAEDLYWGRRALPAGPSKPPPKPPPKPPKPPKPPTSRVTPPPPQRERPPELPPEPPPEAPTTALLPRSVPRSVPQYGAYRRNQSGQDWRAPASGDDWRASTDRWSAVERRTQAIERRPARPARDDYFTGGGRDLYASSWQDADDDDDAVDDEPMDANSYLAAALSTVAWFVVPALTFLGWVLFLDAAPRNEALRNLGNAAPWIGITVAAGIVLALVLRRLATGWRALTVGFASAVVSAGVATVLFTVISQ